MRKELLLPSFGEKKTEVVENKLPQVTKLGGGIPKPEFLTQALYKEEYSDAPPTYLNIMKL